MVNHNSSEKEMDKKKKDPFDEIIEILQKYDEGFERDSKTEYEY